METYALYGTHREVRQVRLVRQWARCEADPDAPCTRGQKYLWQLARMWTVFPHPARDRRLTETFLGRIRRAYGLAVRRARIRGLGAGAGSLDGVTLSTLPGA